MELHPSPLSWRIALVTALVSGAVTAAAAALVAGGTELPVLWALVAIASLATFVPAIGALTATVDVDSEGVTVRRLGRTRRYAWGDVAEVDVAERRASVPDGTEYHWMFPSIPRHMVAVPCLVLADGTRRELPALAAPAESSGAAHEHVAILRAAGARLSVPA